MTATKTAALLAISASLVLAPYAALAARPEPAPLLICSVDSACFTEFADLCSAIETSDLNDRTRNGLVTKVNDDAKMIGTEMEGILQRSAQMGQLTSEQAVRAGNVNEISVETAQVAAETVKGAGVVVSITDELKKVSQRLTQQVRQFKI